MQKKLISVFLILSLLLSSFVINFESNAAYYPSDSEIISKSAEIIRSNEGWYHSVNANDNGALSVGWLQWHANRALELLRSIIFAEVTESWYILGAPLYDEIMNLETSWQTRILNEDEKAKISALLDTEVGHIEQDKLAAKDIISYINHGRQLGITSPAALVYFADMENQCGAGGAKRVVESINISLYPLGITLDVLHSAALASTNAGRYPARRNKVYNYALLLGWEENPNAEKYEIWMVDATVNIRSGAGTEHTLVSQYYKGTKVAVFEKKVNGDYYWGRTEVGWITLDYCSFIRSTVENENIRILFDAGEGELQTAPDITRKVDGVNVARGSNVLVVYTPEHGATTGTDVFGIDISIGADNKVLLLNNDGNTTIPTGGYVVSGSSSGAWFLDNLALGDYVIFDRYNMTFSRYKDYNSYLASTKITSYGSKIGELPIPKREGYKFLGWFDENEAQVTSKTYNTRTDTIKLTAKYEPITVSIMFDEAGEADVLKSEITANVINGYRFQDYVVVYNSERGATTNTNNYGCEAAVDSNGFVISINDQKGNIAIPAGGFVISGHDAGRSWILSNIAVGDKITVDYTTKLVQVYSVSANANLKFEIAYGETIKELFTPVKEGCVFYGWYTEDGALVRNGDKSSFTKDTVLYANWKLKGIAGDVNCDGSVNSLDLLCIKKKIEGTYDCEFGDFDLNGDGVVNQRDIFAFRKILKNGAI